MAAITVIGAGIVGLATAAELAGRGLRVRVLEAEDRPAAHQTGHNSGVIHSGLYYRPGSHKARLCTGGRDALYRFCAAEGIAHRRTGKVVLALREEEIPRLDELERRGRANGLEGLERLPPGELAARLADLSDRPDPAGLGELAGVDALWVPQTGIVDFRAVSRVLAGKLEAAGGELRTGAAVTGIREGGRGGGAAPVVLETAAGRFECDLLINCAGLQSDRVARLGGFRPGLRIVPFRGEYHELTGRAGARVPVPVYPVPDPRFPFLGVHLTPTVDGRVEAGPNAVLALHRHGYTRGRVSLRDLASTLGWPGFWRLAARHWRFGLREMRRSLSSRAFVAAVRELMPELSRDDFRPGGAGVRAQALDRSGELVDDFRFAEDERQIHVLNAPSPAATAALAIGREVAERALAKIG
ncbi:MAG: L-2-hydroxyglutarate oxidase [Acidobacteriota bacterium]